MDQNSKLKAELSELEKQVDIRKQKFIDVETEMEEADDIFERLAEMQRVRGIEPPERD